MHIRTITVSAAMALGSLSAAGRVCPAASTPAPVTATSADAPAHRGDGVRSGFAWLVRTQHPNGGWGQGEESLHMRDAATALRDQPNLADTCMAALALLRSGSSPAAGEYAASIRNAVGFILREVEGADRDSLYVTSVRGTRLQSKLGTYIDTFLTALVLAEVKGRMPDETFNRRVLAGLDKVMDKIERNQRGNGTWENAGWAPVLAQSVAAKAINRAAQVGFQVSEEIRSRTEEYARKQFDSKSGVFRGEGSAGIDLYSSAAHLGAMQDSDNTNRVQEKDFDEKLRNARTERERQEARQELGRIRANRRDLEQARFAVAKKLADQRFVQGFGSNGGEEYLSYLSIGESLAARGGEEWQNWNRSITDNLLRVQNQDGTWTGHHCITGRTFCTSAALLVLTLDRSPASISENLRRR